MNSAAAIPAPAVEAVMEKGPDPAAFSELVRVYRRWEAEHPVVTGRNKSKCSNEQREIRKIIFNVQFSLEGEMANNNVRQIRLVQDIRDNSGDTKFFVAKGTICNLVSVEHNDRTGDYVIAELEDKSSSFPLDLEEFELCNRRKIRMIRDFAWSPSQVLMKGTILDFILDEGSYVSAVLEDGTECFVIDHDDFEFIDVAEPDEPDEPVMDYRCQICGTPITAAEADDNGGLCGKDHPMESE